MGQAQPHVKSGHRATLVQSSVWLTGVSLAGSSRPRCAARRGPGVTPAWLLLTTCRRLFATDESLRFRVAVATHMSVYWTA